MKKVLKILIYIIFGLILGFGVFLGYSTVSDYKPEPVELISESKGSVISVYDTLRVLNWNIGYCGLGKNMDFFYDGGEKTRDSKENTENNFKEVVKLLKKHDSIDVFLFQEVDRNSRRSHKLDQFEMLKQELPDFSSCFAYNYKVTFVPVPPNNPMGKVEGGLASFSKYEPFKVKRYSFKGNYEWPKSLFMLDRCFMVKRFYTSNGKELVMVNTHNSAYDTGTLRKQQMLQLKEFLLKEYEMGNYVMVGGDWNQNPPHKGETRQKSKEGHLTRIRIAHNFMAKDWSWVYNEETPTNRMLDEPYSEKTTGTTVLDFYLISPNLVSINHKNIDLGFENSDHHPVLISIGFNR